LKVKSDLVKKGWKVLWDVVEKSDVVLEILDIRDPEAFRNKKVEERVKRMGKVLILVLNKADLVPKWVVEQWKRYLEQEYPTVVASVWRRKGKGRIKELILKLVDKRPVIVCVVGYPNVGKSSIINLLRGEYSARTSSMPGFTRGMQLFNITPEIKVFDTPGVFPTETDFVALYKGALRIEQVGDAVATTAQFIEFLLKKRPNIFKKYYGITEKDPFKIIEIFAKKRNMLMKGGQLDLDRAAKRIVRDWQEGKLVLWHRPPKRPKKIKQQQQQKYANSL